MKYLKLFENVGYEKDIKNFLNKKITKDTNDLKQLVVWIDSKFKNESEIYEPDEIEGTPKDYLIVTVYYREKFKMSSTYYEGNVETKLNSVFEFFESLVEPIKTQFESVFSDVELFTDSEDQDLFGLRTKTKGEEVDSWSLSEDYGMGALTYQCTLKEEIVRATKTGLWGLK